MNEIVSIITPSYNRAGLVTETAASILAQTYPFWEWVIVDDGSTDNSWEVLQNLAAKDERIKIFQRTREPKGACTCRNIAVENCTGRYVLFLDTDDVLAPFCLEQRVLAMQQHSDCDFVIFPMLMFKKELDDLNVLWNVDNHKDDIHRILTGDAVCQGTGPLWKKASFVEVGMWREDLHLWQDTELHIKSILWPMKYVKRLDLKPDVYLRISYTSLSRSGYYSLPKLQSRITIFFYTCEIMKEKGVLDKYRADLRNMAGDLCMSAIVGGLFSEANRILKFCEPYRFFNKAEVRNIKNYLLIRKYKLGKIKSVESFFYKKTKHMEEEAKSYIGKIAWKTPSVSHAL
ncbi:MAG: glycosyltransferase family A protein [Ferruginibacter sp.]